MPSKMYYVEVSKVTLNNLEKIDDRVGLLELDDDSIEPYIAHQISLKLKGEEKKKFEETHEDELELFKKGILNDIILPYDEIYVLAGKDGFGRKSGVIYRKHEGGITLEDIAIVFYDFLNSKKYGFFFEGLTYRGDFKGIPVYFMYMGT